jgi:hypothetical protein
VTSDEGVFTRCSECGSWAEACINDTPQPDCGCQRCLRAKLAALERSRDDHRLAEAAAWRQRAEMRAEKDDVEKRVKEVERLNKRLTEQRDHARGKLAAELRRIERLSLLARASQSRVHNARVLRAHNRKLATAIRALVSVVELYYEVTINPDREAAMDSAKAALRP